MTVRKVQKKQPSLIQAAKAALAALSGKGTVAMVLREAIRREETLNKKLRVLNKDIRSIDKRVESTLRQCPPGHPPGCPCQYE